MNQSVSVDSEKIKNAVRMGLPITITTYAFPRRVAMYTDLILAEFLKELQHPEMQDFLSYVIGELATNAKKANTKRVYFAEKKLDVNNELDYDSGMQSFKADMLANLQHYLKLQKDAGLYIKIVLCRSSNDLIIEVRNNTELAEIEFKRIFDKLARSRKYTALEDVLPDAIDDNEGAGLGILISLLMLRQIGVPDENFLVLVENGETVMRIVVPVVEMTPANITGFSRQIAGYIKAVPQFPDSIMQIEHLLNDPEVEMGEIANSIASDVAISADLLKLVNSAAYGLPRRIASIPYAVNLVGTRGIRNLIYSIGAMRVLDAETERQSELWALSYKAAFYAGWIARNRIKKTAITDAAYVCGLLHYLGKIVLAFVYPGSDLQEKIKELKESRHIPDNIFNVLTSEINHPEIGAALAEKWNLPPPIVNAIRFQHNYEKAPEEFKPLAALVSLVDIIIQYQAGDVTFSQISPELLKMFFVSTEAQFNELTILLEEAFASSFEAKQTNSQAPEDADDS